MWFYVVCISCLWFLIIFVYVCFVMLFVVLPEIVFVWLVD